LHLILFEFELTFVVMELKPLAPSRCLYSQRRLSIDSNIAAIPYQVDLHVRMLHARALDLHNSSVVPGKINVRYVKGKISSERRRNVLSVC
jgi:hypothetical protein